MDRRMAQDSQGGRGGLVGGKADVSEKKGEKDTGMFQGL